MKRRWKISPQNKELQRCLSSELNVSPLLAQLLINRGLVDSDKAFSFLSPSLQDLHDPFLLKDMGKACERLVKALKKGEKVAVYGDFDVDGVTATALLYSFLKEVGFDVDYYIPERLSEGYGLNCGALDIITHRDIRLVITADCGISNADEVIFAKERGVDVIVTDHHEVPEDMPPALAVLNPKQSGCKFPFKGLAGVGVAFNLIVALRASLRECGYFSNGIPNLKRFLDLVALGTIADIVPLVDENRVLVKFGLEEIANSARFGIKALKEVCRIRSGAVKSRQVGFQLAPRINAAGRLKRADMAVKLLITEDMKEATELARMLDSENNTRQGIERKMLQEAISMLEAEGLQSGAYSGKGIVLSSASWHPGVVGIVASRLAERFNRPTILFASDGETARGSGRGVRGIDILDCLKRCSGLLERYGGHKAAAGITIKAKNIEKFKGIFLDLLNREVGDEDLVPEVSVDALVALNDLNQKVVTDIGRLAPFGYCNAEPVLGVRGTHILETDIVAERHLRLKVGQGGSVWHAIGYGLADRHPLKGEGFDIVFSPYIDEWNGKKNLKMRVKEL